MTAHIIRRLITAFPALLLVTLVMFLVMQLAGDPADLILPQDATEADKAAFRQAYGLDKPVYVQYGYFVANALRGNFGKSLRYNRPATEVVLQRIPASAYLAGASVLLAVLIAVPIGILAGLKQGTLLDQGVLLIAALGQSIAGFWLAMMLILLFGVILKVLPVAGMESPQHIILPTIALAFNSIALKARLIRSGMLEVLRQDYVRTARSKGLTENVVIIRHALKNALIPVVTVIFTNIAFLLGGAVLIEVVFAWPGVGSLILDAVNGQDLPVMLAGVTYVAVAFIFILLLLDIVYVFIDPRIKYK